MASAELSRRVEKVVDYPPLSEMSDQERRELYEALLGADTFEDLTPGCRRTPYSGDAPARRVVIVVRGRAALSGHSAAHLERDLLAPKGVTLKVWGVGLEVVMQVEFPLSAAATDDSARLLLRATCGSAEQRID